MDVTRNIFRIGRRPDDEDQLTEMLAWLCEVVPEVRATVFELAGVSAADPNTITVRTQQSVPGGCLDVLLETDDTTIIVESKLLSVYGRDQLEKYCRWLAAYRPEKRRCLLTLTKAEDPWPGTATALAGDLGVRAAARRWQDIYSQLSGLAEHQPPDDRYTHLITSFAAMLAAEGLIPIAPIQPDEFDAWATSASVVARFHDYFDAARATIAEALDATIYASRAGAKSPASTWQGFQTTYGWFIYVGIWAGSERWPARAESDRKSEPVFGAALLEPSERRVVVPHALTPVGWTGGAVAALYGHAGIWRPLGSVLTGTTLAQQMHEVASACIEVKDWAQRGYFAHVESQGSRVGL